MQYNHKATQDQDLRTQYRLNAPQSDSASQPTSPTRLPTLEPNLTPLLTTIQKDSVTSQKKPEVTNNKQTETVTTSQKVASEREESGSANSGAGAELTSQGKERDSKVTSGYGHLTEEERRRLTLETIQKELDRETQLHPHHPQQRPKPTLKTAVSTPSPVLSSARQAPFRPASPRRRRRKHRKRISKAAIRAMIM